MIAGAPTCGLVGWIETSCGPICTETGATLPGWPFNVFAGVCAFVCPRLVVLL
jgi:hypothetical protein